MENFFARFAEPRYLRTDFGLKLSLHFEVAVLAGHGIRFLSQLQRYQCKGKPQRLRLRQNHWERVTSSSAVPMDGRSLNDSTAWCDLCPVTDFMCLVSQLWSDRTVTAVALRQWLVRFGSMPARLLIFYNILSSVLGSTGELQYQILSSAGLNFWLWPCSPAHILQHFVQRARVNRRVAIPDFIICWTEFLTLAVSWILEKSVGTRVQVI